MLGAIRDYITPLKMNSTPPPEDDSWYIDPSMGLAVSRGIKINEDTAMSVSAVFACVRILAESIASLPLKIYQRDGDNKTEAVNHPLYDLLHDQPNSWQTSFEWREMMMAHLCLRGNAYSEIIPGRRGTVDQLIPRHPGRMEVKPVKVNNKIVDGRFQYVYTQLNGMQRKIPQDLIYHVRFMSMDGMKGISPIKAAAMGIALSLKAEKYGTDIFDKGGTKRLALKHPGAIDKKAARRLRTSWREAYGGTDYHKVAVLEEGLEPVVIGMTAEDAQLLDTRRFQAIDIARIYRVPLYMIQEHTKNTSWGTGIEQMNIGFVVHTLRPWLVRWEQTITRDLILYPKKYFAEFLVDGLLRGDTKSRYTAYNLGRNGGWLSVNEIRKFENQNSIGPEGDIYLEPLNMVPAGQQDRLADTVKATQVNSILVDEVTDRIASREINALPRLVSACKGANWHNKFMEWCEKHKVYVAGALAPLSQVHHANTGMGIDVDVTAWNIVQKITDRHIEAEDGAFTIIKSSRTGEIKQILNEVLYGTN